MNIDTMKMSATNFGFDPAWIAQVLAKYGPDVLSIVLEAARNGLSVGLIMEVLQKFGPHALDLLISILNHKNLKRIGADIVDGPVVTGDNVLTPADSTFIDIIIQKYLPILIQQYLPIIIQKYGPQLLQLAVDAIIQYLQSLQPQPQQPK